MAARKILAFILNLFQLFISLYLLFWLIKLIASHIDDRLVNDLSLPLVLKNILLKEPTPPSEKKAPDTVREVQERPIEERKPIEEEDITLLKPLKKAKGFCISHSCSAKSVFEAPILKSNPNDKNFFEKPFNCGEDALSHFHDAAMNCTVLAIADGVGSWTMYGIDPSKFSWTLVLNVVSSFKVLATERKKNIYPMELLEDAHAKIMRDKIVTGGSSTAIVVLIHHSARTLSAVVVGDSKLYLFRQGEFIINSVPQQRGYNQPFQLSPQFITDRASDGNVYNSDIQSGDIILLVTDGIPDNIFDKDLKTSLDILLKELSSISSTTDASNYEEAVQTLLNNYTKGIVKKAIALAQQIDYLSPFAVYTRAQKVNPYYLGGKVDDSSILLMYIT